MKLALGQKRKSFDQDVKTVSRDKTGSGENLERFAPLFFVGRKEGRVDAVGDDGSVFGPEFGSLKG